MGGGAGAVDLVEGHGLAAASDFETVGVVRPEGEEVLAAILARPLAKLVGQRPVKRHHERFRRISGVDRSAVCLAAEQQSSLGAPEAQGQGYTRLVEAV